MRSTKRSPRITVRSARFPQPPCWAATKTWKRSSVSSMKLPHLHARQPDQAQNAATEIGQASRSPPASLWSHRSQRYIRGAYDAVSAAAQVRARRARHAVRTSRARGDEAPRPVLGERLRGLGRRIDRDLANLRGADAGTDLGVDVDDDHF